MLLQLVFFGKKYKHFILQVIYTQVVTLLSIWLSVYLDTKYYENLKNF